MSLFDVYLFGEDLLVVLDAFVPHRLQDGGERRHTNPGPHQHHHLVAKYVLAGSPEGAVNGQPESKKIGLVAGSSLSNHLE